MPSPFGSTPNGELPFRPSMPRMFGRSSPLIGLTRRAVTKNISSVSFFSNDFDLKSAPITGMSLTIGILDKVLVSELSSKPASAND